MEKYLHGTAETMLKAFFAGGNAQGMSSTTIAEVIKEICEIVDKHGITQ